jgi:hypothetical protein
MHQPVTQTDAIALINSMIATLNLSQVIIQWGKCIFLENLKIREKKMEKISKREQCALMKFEQTDAM